MTPFERLSELCHWSNPNFDHPLTLEAQGKRWAFASDGHAFLMLEAGQEWQAHDAPKHVANAVPGWLERPSEEQPWAPLYQFVAGEHELRVRCKRCGGDGEYECPTCGDVGQCSACDGEGVTGRETEPVLLFGTPFDAALVHRYAATLEADSVQLTPGADTEPMLVRGPGWILAVMPLAERERNFAKRSYP